MSADASAIGVGPRVDSARAPVDRVPLALLCCILSFLDSDAHAAASTVSRPLRRAARLPEASCHDVAVRWNSKLACLASLQLLQRPRVVRFDRLVDAQCFNATCAWLATATRLHTIRFGHTPSELYALSRVGSLRHLFLDTPSTCSVATALHVCSSRLQSLHLWNADYVSVSVVINLRNQSGDGPKFCATTIAAQLALCTAIESLTFHMARDKDTVFLTVLGATDMPALRSLSFSQMVAGTSALAGLSRHTGLTSLCYHVADADTMWPLLGGLQTLDLGSSGSAHDYAAIYAAFPRLGRLRISCAYPAKLAGFTELTDLTVVDPRPSELGWVDFMDDFAALLPQLTKLERLGVQCSRRQDTVQDRVWRMPRVSQLTLCLRTATYPRIRAPLLRSLRVSDAPRNADFCETVAETVRCSPLLRLVECVSLVPLLESGALADALKRTKGRARLVNTQRQLNLECDHRSRPFAAADNWL